MITHLSLWYDFNTTIGISAMIYVRKTPVSSHFDVFLGLDYPKFLKMDQITLIFLFYPLNLLTLLVQVVIQIIHDKVLK